MSYVKDGLNVAPTLQLRRGGMVRADVAPFFDPAWSKRLLRLPFPRQPLSLGVLGGRRNLPHFSDRDLIT